MIVVEVLKFWAVVVPAQRRNTIEMRVDRPGMIVIRSRLRSRMDVLERRQKEGQKEGKARLERSGTTHSNVSVHFRGYGDTNTKAGGNWLPIL